MRRLALLALIALLPAACSHEKPPAPTLQAHYVLGQPYQIGGVWYYPREQYGVSSTGLAVVYPSGHAGVTADGEAYDANALAVADRTIQLPAIARLTDLKTGRQVLVRINDRGPDNPGRLVAVTPHVAALLGFPSNGIAQVRLDVLPVQSHAVTDALPDAPRLAMTAAPRVAVLAENLDGPPRPAPVDAATPTAVAPEQLSSRVTQVPPSPGALYVRLSRFTARNYAARQAAGIAGPSEVERLGDLGGTGYRARLGPFATVDGADAALDQAMRAGVSDARIVVE